MITYHGHNNPLYKAHKNVGAHYIRQNTVKHAVYGSSDEYKKEHDVKEGSFVSNHNSALCSLPNVQILNPC